MKQLIVLIGPNGVGKTTAAMKITEQNPNSAYVDSDWCRVMNPFSLTDATKKTVIGNIYCLLKNYLICEEIANVIFTYGWHGVRKEIYDLVIEKLHSDGIEFKENIVVLKCTIDENRRRALADGRDIERVERGMKQTFSFYDEFEYPSIDTTEMNVSEVARRVWELTHST